MFSRRDFMAKLAIMGTSVITMTGLPGWTNAAKSGILTSDKKELIVFMELSRELTGFDNLDANLGKSFYQYQKKYSNSEVWLRLLDTFQTTRFPQTSGPLDLTKAKLMEDPEVWKIAKSITKLWYSGWLSPHGDIPLSTRAFAYKQSLVWKAMKLLPKGIPSGQLWQNLAK